MRTKTGGKNSPNSEGSDSFLSLLRKMKESFRPKENAYSKKRKEA